MLESQRADPRWLPVTTVDKETDMSKLLWNAWQTCELGVKFVQSLDREQLILTLVLQNAVNLTPDNQLCICWHLVFAIPSTDQDRAIKGWPYKQCRSSRFYSNLSKVCSHRSLCLMFSAELLPNFDSTSTTVLYSNPPSPETAPSRNTICTEMHEMQTQFLLFMCVGIVHQRHYLWRNTWKTNTWNSEPPVSIAHHVMLNAIWWIQPSWYRGFNFRTHVGPLVLLSAEAHLYAVDAKFSLPSAKGFLLPHSYFSPLLTSTWCTTHIS